ncbi:MAG: 4Fe-4S dicluster domain-containing protein [Thermoplasmata archaeon]|nr:4Fe-4S dicluster domain-containing protein [Thermoplasmata archaeon]
MIETNNLDKDFKYEFAKEHGGENIKHCFTCGTCSVVCPVFDLEENFDPRKIIRMIILGMRDEVLKSETIWLCSGCYSCYELCPRDVKITNVFSAARNMAVREGHTPPAMRTSVDFLNKLGRLLEVSDFENTVREKKEIPTLELTIPQVKEILKKAGIQEAMDGGEANE